MRFALRRSHQWYLFMKHQKSSITFVFHYFTSGCYFVEATALLKVIEI